MRRGIRTVAQFDRLAKRGFGVVPVLHSQLRRAQHVVGLVERRKRFDGSLELGDAASPVLDLQALNSSVESIAGFAGDAQFMDGNNGIAVDCPRLIDVFGLTIADSRKNQNCKKTKW